MTDKNKITETARDLSDKAKAQAQDLGDKAKVQAEKAKAQAQELGDKAKVQAEKAKEKAKTAASDAGEAVRGAIKDEKGDWTTRAKVGAAVGSAAIAAAIIYAGRHKMKKVDELQSNKGIRYEDEPDIDGDDDDLAVDYDGGSEEE